MSKGDLGRLAAGHEALFRSRPEADAWLSSWAATWPNAVAQRAAQAWDLRGPCLAPVAACATGLIAALAGADLIRRGVATWPWPAAGDASLDPLVLGAFRRMGILPRRPQGEATTPAAPSGRGTGAARGSWSARERRCSSWNALTTPAPGASPPTPSSPAAPAAPMPIT